VLDDLSWQVIVYALLSLTAVRMLPVWLSLLGSGARPPTLAFGGCSARVDSRQSSSP
jgi:NhaP-type Na+/H+ or K+/H+ antiporter